MKKIVAVCAVLVCGAVFARGILPSMVYRRGLTNEQIDQILARHPDAQLRITAQDWRGMQYQLHRFGNMTNYVEQIGNSNDCAKVLLRLHDVGEELSRSNSTLRVSLDRADRAVDAWRETAAQWQAEAETNAAAAQVTKELRKAVKRAEKNLSKIVKRIEQAKKEAGSEEEAELYDLLIEILSDPGKEDG